MMTVRYPLLIYAIETSQSCQKHKIGCVLLSFRCMTNYMKMYLFLYAHFTETTNVVENLLIKTYSETFIYYKDKLLL